jgi:hypothetical protein
VEHINAYISLYRDLDVTPTSTSGRSLVSDATSGQELTESVEKRLAKKSRGFQTRDRSYKTPFRPKTFQKKIPSSYFFANFHPKNNRYNFFTVLLTMIFYSQVF